jgi:hypothetical protein
MTTNRRLSIASVLFLSAGAPVAPGRKEHCGITSAPCSFFAGNLRHHIYAAGVTPPWVRAQQERTRF